MILHLKFFIFFVVNNKAPPHPFSPLCTDSELIHLLYYFDVAASPVIPSFSKVGNIVLLIIKTAAFDVIAFALLEETSNWCKGNIGDQSLVGIDFFKSKYNWIVKL